MKKKLPILSIGIGLLATVPLVASIAISCAKVPETNNNQPPLQPQPPKPNKNLKYNFELSKDNTKITNVNYTTEPVDFNIAINNAKNTINQEWQENNIKEYLKEWTRYYINFFKSSRQETCTIELKEFNISINNEKQISGNIKFEIIWNKNMDGILIQAKRYAGDREIHNFVFENNHIEPYINYSITNYLSFKIQTKYFQKQLISSNPSNERYNVGFKQEYIYLDCVKPILLELPNSLFSIDADWYIKNMYLYKTSNSNQQVVINEVVSSILNRTAKLVVAGKNPVDNNRTLTSPILVVELKTSSNNLDLNWTKNLSEELSNLFPFITRAKPMTHKNNNLYITCWKPVINYIAPNNLLDLSSPNQNTMYNKDYRDLNNLSKIYLEANQIKETVLTNNKQKVSGDWITFVKSLPDLEKAKKVYDWMLPYTYYGGMTKPHAGTIEGYIYKGVVCEGYAKIFSYFSIMLKIESISCTGMVKQNAIPGQTSAEGAHAWNLIKVNNEWKWCDPTWDDGFGLVSTSYKFDYFLKTSSEFFTDQTHLNITNWNNGNDLPISIK